MYMPTYDRQKEDIQTIYEQLEITIKKSRDDRVINMDDSNAVVGANKDDKAVGDYRLSRRNDRRRCE